MLIVDRVEVGLDSVALGAMGELGSVEGPAESLDLGAQAVTLFARRTAKVVERSASLVELGKRFLQLDTDTTKFGPRGGQLVVAWFELLLERRTRCAEGVELLIALPGPGKGDKSNYWIIGLIPNAIKLRINSLLSKDLR
jgi:hypothetical protein